MENKVKESYEKIKISDSAIQRIKEQIEMDGEMSCENKVPFFMNKLKVVAAACLLLIILLPSGVYAAGKIYQYIMSYKENGYKVDMEMKNADDIDAEDSENAVTEMNESESIKEEEGQICVPSQYIRIVADWGNEYKAEYKCGDQVCINSVSGFDSGKSFWYRVIYIDDDMKALISNYDTKENERITVNGRKAVYSKYNSIVGSKYEENEKTSYGQSIFVFIEDYGYVIEMGAQNGLPKEEFIQLANQLKIEEVDSEQDATSFVLFSEWVGAGWNLAANSDNNPKEIKNYYEEKATFGNTVYQIKDVQILDGVENLRTEAFNYNHFDMESLVAEDGKLRKYDRELLQLGDGITEPRAKVIKTEHIQPKLVYVTLEVTNSAENSFDGLFYIPSLKFVTKRNGKVYANEDWYNYKRPHNIEEACIDLEPCYIEDNLGGKSSMAVRASVDAQTIRCAYLVDEDFIDGMTLWLNDYCDTASEPYCLEISK